MEDFHMNAKIFPVAFAAGILLSSSHAVFADDLDFEGLPAGTIVSELSKNKGISGNLTGVVLVEGHNTLFPSTNAAILFDSECIPGPPSCETQDRDLATPHEDFGGPGIGIGGSASGPYPNDTPLGNILILAKNLVDVNPPDGLIDDPDDADVPGFINFDFSGVKKGKTDGTVVINSITIMDVDLSEGEDPGLITLSGPGIPTATIAVFDTENGGVKTLDGIGLAGVSNLRVEVKGSSAFAGIVFGEKVERSCWITTGGFHNAGVQSGGKDFTFGGNVGPPPSGSWEVIDHNTGDNFHSNNVVITDCIEIDGTGPGQPGGKKGFVINQAFFEGIGRLNHVDGYPFTGFVVDRGEPSGKDENDKDQFHIEVRDPVTSVIVFETDFLLDGGNVQIHPPVGKNN
jgi:hypothetical protein